jgi:hypothetical protein
MKLITTTLGSYITGDEIADAVLDYSHALARDQATDLVDIPVLVDHSTARLRLTIGWLVPLHSLGTTSTQPEIVDHAATNDLRSRTEMRLEGNSGTARPMDLWTAETEFFDY